MKKTLSYVTCTPYTCASKNDGSAASRPEHKASTSQCSDKKSVSVLVTCGIRKAHTGPLDRLQQLVFVSAGVQ